MHQFLILFLILHCSNSFGQASGDQNLIKQRLRIDLWYNGIEKTTPPVVVIKKTR